MELAVRLVERNIAEGGGPFAAVITDASGRLTAVGYNCVVSRCDSTAHAEVEAIRRGQHMLGTHSFASLPGRSFTLYSSCAPCIMCFGAIWWSGLSAVYSCLTKEDAERVGFLEGPVSPLLWQVLEKERGTVHHGCFHDSQRLRQAMAEFRKRGQLY